MAKTTYRNAKKEKYTPISNTLLWDKEITLQAKGLLAIFLSNSNEWELNMKEIITRSKNGRDAHYKVVNELIKHGYFARVQVFKPGVSSFEEMIYIFSDVKEEVAQELENVKKMVEADGKSLLIEYKDRNDKKKDKTSEKPVVSLVTDSQDTETKLPADQYINNTKGNKTNLNNINEEEEEEEDITPAIVMAFMNEQIAKREITNQKTITAIFEVAAKCKAIGTTNRESMENYCIKVVEDKMKMFGQKQGKSGTSKKSSRTEPVPDWLEDRDSVDQEPAKENSADFEERKAQLEERLKKYKK